MSLRLGDIAPDFKAKTSIGDISFHEYLGDSWGILFSHPADFTPVCTTELGRTAALYDEWMGWRAIKHGSMILMKHSMLQLTSQLLQTRTRRLHTLMI